MSQVQFEQTVQMAQQWRETEWACAYCGESAEGAPDPSVFACCGEMGHVELVDKETGEPI